MLALYENPRSGTMTAGEGKILLAVLGVYIQDAKSGYKPVIEYLVVDEDGSARGTHPRLVPGSEVSVYIGKSY